jgi:hypothetical protein
MKTDLLQTYKGSCHCGRVTFEIQAKLDSLVECNCSICRRRGALWHGVPRWAVNVRCIDGVDLSALPVRRFDGEHWEDAAKAFRAAPRQ